MTLDSVTGILTKHIPSGAVDYCLHLWREAPFILKLSRSRSSKIGDFTCRERVHHPQITLNHDLNPYLFVTTFVHEVAHYRVFIKHRNRVDPHGEEWKHVFQELLQPLLLKIDVFPEEILHALRLHMVEPKASSYADSMLTQAFRKFDRNYEHQVLLSEIPLGSIFKFNGKYFQKGKLRRTRVLCKEVSSRLQYLVPADAVVSDVQLGLL